MNDAIIHRGPDEAGFLLQDNVGLAMRRLSIIDLAGGAQPIYNEDKRVCVFYNGEIYNSPDLREDLLARGHRFRTHTDTEVIVHLYEEYGDDLVLHLEGMFAFALWDDRKRRLLIARDHLGIKPLFYQHNDRGFFFGSEIKCLKAVPGQSLSLNYQALDFFLAYTYIPAPYTIYKEVHKLPAGHRLVLENDYLRVDQYWDLPAAGSASVRQEEMQEMIVASVSAHLLSDVPVGSFLSGGVDSSLVTALVAAQQRHPVQTFTMSFVGEKIPLADERVYARQVAERYGTQYNDFQVPPDPNAVLPEIVRAFDEPFSDDSVFPSYYICKLTAAKLKVALSGLGGDELFAGYNRYSGLLLSRYYRWLPRPVHRFLVDPLVRRLPEPRNGADKVDHLKRFCASALATPADRYVGYLTALDGDGRAALYSDAVRPRIDTRRTREHYTRLFDGHDGDLISKALYTDMKTYLPEDILALSDRLSMWHSLEVRVPLATPALFEYASRVPTAMKISLREKKIMLKRIAREYLPEQVISHRKQGFEAPMANWLRNDLREYCTAALAESRVAQAGIFNPRVTGQMVSDHMSGKRKNNKILFSLLVFSEWLNQNPDVSR